MRDLGREVAEGRGRVQHLGLIESLTRSVDLYSERETGENSLPVTAVVDDDDVPVRRRTGLLKKSEKAKGKEGGSARPSRSTLSPSLFSRHAVRAYGELVVPE
jgi:hypothetical protein